MKKDELKELVNPSNESIEKKDKGVLRKTLIIGFLLISCVSLVYAGVKTLEKRNLTNDQGKIVGSLENEDTDENNHLDSHMTREELFRYGDELSASQEWSNKSFVVIDTEVGYPSGIDVRPISQQINDYREIDLNDDLLILPEVLGDYKFSNLSIHYQADFPDEDAIATMIEDADEERFIVKEIETGEAWSMSYYYKSIEGKLTMRINLEVEEESRITGKLENLEVIDIDDVDVYITESDYMGVAYRTNKTLKLKGVNHFKTTWYDAYHKIKVNVNPGLNNSDHEVEEEINGEYILTTTYPENTKEALMSFTEILYETLKSIE